MSEKKSKVVTGDYLSEVKLDRPVGLVGAISLVIGGVIGMGIYALIASVGAYAGNAMWLAFTAALLISVIGVIPIIQIASALPRAGAGYLYASRLLHPLVGLITSWWVVFAVANTLTFVSMGMADYIAKTLNIEDPKMILYLTILFPVIFYLLYFLGVRLAILIQIVLVALLIVALLAYGIMGTLEVGLKFSTYLPQGIGGFIMATVLCYTAFFGFQVIAEMGEEMQNAKRNIPLSLFIGGVSILVIYIIVGTVFITSVEYNFEAIKAIKAPLMDSGKGFLPYFWVLMLGLGAIAAGLTSFNGGAIAIPRELFSQARDEIIPAFIGKIHKRSGSPMIAMGLFFLLVIVMILMRWDIDYYGAITAVGILLMTAMISVSALRLTKKYPKAYKNAYLNIPRALLWIIVILSIISCLGFIALVMTEAMSIGYMYIGATLVTVIYYLIRMVFLKARGVDFSKRMERMPGFDED
ncbi:MAG: APC family permease [Deltaproteobacteria bacterium]|uniref:APC family permease n=1 Tax=Candidatus Zymogenus saltonus TaxID=2844893 RepID=A0A9D8KG01_9DELT|nr:APC family permease [Candidatus Zymogenus saltonus]